MSHIRQRIEQGFQGLTDRLYRFYYLVLPALLLLAGALVSQIPHITIDTSTEGFLHESDPTLAAYYDFRAQFGREDVIVLALNPHDVFDLEFLRKLQSLHKELEAEVPNLDEVNSLINARNTRAKGDQLIVEDLFENWPLDRAALEVIKKRALENPIYKNLMLSEDGKFTTVMIRTVSHKQAISADDALSGFDSPSDKEAPKLSSHELVKQNQLTDAENSAVVAKVKEIVKRYDSADFPITIAGPPTVTDNLKRSMQRDMQGFMRLALLMIIITLFLMFRRVTGVLLPLLVVIFTIASTAGLMAITKTPIKLPTQILPSFLMAVSVGAAVHVLAVFYRKLHDLHDKRAAIVHAMGHSGLAIVMTSLTTAAGLLSFAGAQVAPISDLGLMAGSGVLFSLFYTIVLLPALIALFPIRDKREKAKEAARHQRMDRLLAAIARFAVQRAVAICAVSGIMIAAAVWAVTNLQFAHHPLLWFPKDDPIRVGTQLIDDKMRGTVSLELILDSQKTNGLHDPNLLQQIKQLQSQLQGVSYKDIFTGKTLALPDLVMEIHQALNEGKAEFHTIPNNKALLAQELLLFENSGSDDMEDLVDSQFSKARMTIKTPWGEARQIKHYIDVVEQQVHQTLPESVQVTTTGIMSLLGRTLDAAMTSTAKSYIIAAAVITVMMILLMGNISLGLVAMIPNLLPILVVLGGMALAGVPLDMFTMLIGSIAIGLAVDDTIHFMHNFRRYHHQHDDVAKAVHDTLTTTGRAMLVTTVVLSLGFFVFTFADMANVIRFGLLTGVTIILALLADFLLAPALMQLLMRSKKLSHAMMAE